METETEFPLDGGSFGKTEARVELQKACAIAHDKGAGMSLLQLVTLILEDGLPSRSEREKILAAKLASD